MIKVNRRALILMAGGALGLLMGCSGATQENARFRVIHAAPSTGALAVRFNVEVAVNSLAYKSASPYVNILSGGHTLHLVDAATPLGAPRVSRSLEFAGSDYTALIIGASSTLDVVLVPDDSVPSATAGNARLRVVHAASELTGVDVYVTDPAASISSVSPSLTNVAFKGASAYLDLPQGNYRVRVTLTGSKSVISDSGTTTLTKGHVYSSVTVGGFGVSLQNITLVDV